MMKMQSQRVNESATLLKKPVGMTLVEIMIVITIMAMVSGAVGYFVFGTLDTANERTAQMEINQLSQMVETYYMSTTPNELPNNLEDLTEGRNPLTESIPQDPWGNDYIYERHSNRDFDIYSPGADGVEGTEDDIGRD